MSHSERKVRYKAKNRYGKKLKSITNIFARQRDVYGTFTFDSIVFNHIDYYRDLFFVFCFFFKPSPKVATRKRRRQILAVVFRWSAPPKRGSRSVANKRRSRAIRHFKRNLIFGDPKYKRKQQKNKTKQTKQFGRPCRRKRPT